MPVRRYISILLLLLSCSATVRGAVYTYDYNEPCARAYEAYMSLNMQEGRNATIRAIRTDPYNLMATYIADYDDHITLLLNCDRQEYEQRMGHMDERLAILEKGDASSPWYRFCKAGIYLHWALVQVRFGDQYKAANNFRRSFALLKENQRLFPAFEYNKVFSGLEESVIGSLPGNLKWMASIFGMKGELRNGAKKLGDFVASHSEQDPLYAETVLYYSFVRFYLLQEQKEVWEFVNSPQFKTKNNLLNTFAKVNIALDHHKADAATAALGTIAGDANYNQYPIFDYQAGVALLTRLDTGCNMYFRRYLARNKSDLFIKDVWQKMAFAYYMNGNTAQATKCLAMVRTQGGTHTDADKQALRFAEQHVWPQQKILQARYLIEGGYYSRALAILKAMPPVALTAPADKLEYYFRLGKAYQEAGDNNKALENYQLAINNGKERKEQYAARAALQMGMIYERTGMRDQALARYNECLDMPAHDFQNSIDQQAKAGISRLEGK